MNLFPGRTAFRLKDERGTPLAMLISILEAKGMIIEWPSFIEAARDAGWYDYQTLTQMKAALIDADVGDMVVHETIQRFKLYVLAHPRP